MHAGLAALITDCWWNVAVSLLPLLSGCHNQGSQPGRLKTTDVCFLTVLEVRCLNRGGDKTISVCRLEGRVLPWRPLAYRRITSIFAFNITWLSRFLCLYRFSSYKDTSHVEWRAHATLVWLSPALILWSTALLSKIFYSEVLGIRTSTSLLGGHSSTHNTTHMCFCVQKRNSAPLSL